MVISFIQGPLWTPEEQAWRAEIEEAFGPVINERARLENWAQERMRSRLAEVDERWAAEKWERVSQYELDEDSEYEAFLKERALVLEEEGRIVDAVREVGISKVFAGLWYNPPCRLRN